MAMATVCMGGTSIGDKGYLSTAQVGVPALRRLALGRFRVQASTAVAEEPTAVAEKKPVQRLKAQYLEKVVPALTEEFKYTNMHQVPKLQKVIVNCGNGEAAQNAKILEGLQKDLSLITGQKPVVTRAKKAVAAFKLRKDVPVGVAVTLRGDVMYSFLDRLFNLAFPRTRDFQGVSPYSFDGKGNYNVGVKDHSVFPEIKFESIEKQRGFDVSICTTAPTDKEGQKLLTLLGLPFKEGAAKPVKRKGGQWTIKGAKRKVTKTKKK